MPAMLRHGSPVASNDLRAAHPHAQLHTRFRPRRPVDPVRRVRRVAARRLPGPAPRAGRLCVRRVPARARGGRGHPGLRRHAHRLPHAHRAPVVSGVGASGRWGPGRAEFRQRCRARLARLPCHLRPSCPQPNPLPLTPPCRRDEILRHIRPGALRLVLYEGQPQPGAGAAGGQGRWGGAWWRLRGSLLRALQLPHCMPASSNCRHPNPCPPCQAPQRAW